MITSDCSRLEKNDPYWCFSIQTAGIYKGISRNVSLLWNDGKHELMTNTAVYCMRITISTISTAQSVYSVLNSLFASTQISISYEKVWLKGNIAGNSSSSNAIVLIVSRCLDTYRIFVIFNIQELLSKTCSPFNLDVAQIKGWVWYRYTCRYTYFIQHRILAQGTWTLLNI